MSTLSTLFDRLLNHALQLDPDAMRRLRELSGKVILLEIADEHRPLRFYVAPSDSKVRILREYDGVPNVTITGTAAIFLRQLTRGPSVSGELTVRGDIELGQRFQRILANFRPDWEEGASHLIGDIPAHQLGRALGALRDWGRRTLNITGVNIEEYLKEELQVAAKPERVHKFLREVDELRADIDRLEKRIAQLGGHA